MHKVVQRTDDLAASLLDLNRSHLLPNTPVPARRTPFYSCTSSPGPPSTPEQADIIRDSWTAPG